MPPKSVSLTRAWVAEPSRALYTISFIQLHFLEVENYRHGYLTRQNNMHLHFLYEVTLNASYQSWH